MKSAGVITASALTGASGRPFSDSPLKNKPNVLFIIVDDLRPELGCYGQNHIQTPHIDALAAGGFLFDRAYCQLPVCNPSRSSILTGLRPDTLRIYDQQHHFRKRMPFVKTLPQYFKRKGYRTVRIGKIFHDIFPDPPSWSRSEPDIESGSTYQSPETLQRVKDLRMIGQMQGKSQKWQMAMLRGPVDEIWDGPKNSYYDSLITQQALAQLEELKEKGPFFLALGYYKPHLPYAAPRRFWDLYDRKTLPLPAYRRPPENAPFFSLNEHYELSCYEEFKSVRPPVVGGLTEDEIRRLKHGYYACVSFVDEQIGIVLKQLENLGLRDNTIVIIVGDHGTKLGEYGAWGKRTPYEVDGRVSLVLSAPGFRQGQRISSLVELVDIYPTLCELAGLKIPANLEGDSFRPLLEDSTRSWKTAAFTFSMMGATQRNIGRSMRTETHRLIHWSDLLTREHKGYELYDHRTDPGETKNIANEEGSKEILVDLSARLHKGWKAARPKRGKRSPE